MVMDRGADDLAAGPPHHARRTSKCGQLTKHFELCQENVANGEDLPSPSQASLVHPAIREECKQTSECTPLMKHFGCLKEEGANGRGFKAKGWGLHFSVTLFTVGIPNS
ncbi:hypothetical protein D9619_011967 [Psilocybe cf. subviscida]|uniref:Uncharacterized protein n=1 Tax=Psilocybe cf. subviscida TaxID=2480587 RepID=A0A8H5EVZ2_9AGAR|nr:hypothetical protein D9619_011967 [Psilocybe cf. subviscida]